MRAQVSKYLMTICLSHRYLNPRLSVFASGGNCSHDCKRMETKSSLKTSYGVGEGPDSVLESSGAIYRVN